MIGRGRSIAIAAISGALFAIGLVVSGMTTPAKVTGFLDFAGAWDPSLAFVMAAAIAVHLPVVRLAQRRRAPLLDQQFYWPKRRGIDLRLVGGAAIFGVGWGLSGYCPGPAIVSVSFGGAATFAFVGAMLVGLLATRALAAPE